MCGFSDMGRVLCSIVEDTAGWHDTVCGVIDDATMTERYGTQRFQEHRNAMYRSGREGLLKEMGRWGLGRRDLHANVNFFSKVTADADGNLSLQRRKRRRALTWTLRFDMDVLVALSAAPIRFDRRKASYVREAGEAHRLARWHCPCRRLLPQLPRREPARLSSTPSATSPSEESASHAGRKQARPEGRRRR